MVRFVLFIIQSPKEKQYLLISFLLSYLDCSPLMLTVLMFLLFGPIVFLVQSSRSHQYVIKELLLKGNDNIILLLEKETL